MIRHITIFHLILALCALSGCHRQPESFTIYLLDISRSIDPQSVHDEFAAADRFVDKMERGDELDLIPITGDARNELGGHVLRLRAPVERQSFDNDLTAFRATAHKHIATMEAWALQRPPLHTDILGTLDVARQDFGNAAAGPPRLIILSDFIEDDSATNFTKDPRLASVANAKEFADSLTENAEVGCGCDVYLVRLQSNGHRRLSRRRQDAVDAFWLELLSTSENHAAIHSDGVGSL